MSAVPQVTKTGPKTFVPAEAIAGGQVVEARAAGRVGVAAAASLKVLGIAVTDGINPEAFVSSGTVVNGLPTIDATQMPAHVVVAYGGIEVPAKYNAAAAFGDRLVVAALGTVTPAGATPDARTIIGICAEPAGVASGATGLVRTI